MHDTVTRDNNLTRLPPPFQCNCEVDTAWEQRLAVNGGGVRRKRIEDFFWRRRCFSLVSDTQERYVGGDLPSTGGTLCFYVALAIFSDEQCNSAEI